MKIEKSDLKKLCAVANAADKAFDMSRYSSEEDGWVVPVGVFNALRAALDELDPAAEGNYMVEDE